MCEAMDIQYATRLMERCFSLSVKHLRHPAALRLHAHSVSNAAQAVADALTTSEMSVDAGIAAKMGMIHDVGRSSAGDARYGIEGYWLAREAGFSADIARVCITHVTMGRTAKEAIKEGLLTADEARKWADAGFTLEDMRLEEQIVGMVDSRVLDGRWVSLEERIGELEERKGPLSPGIRYNLDRTAEFVASVERALGHPLVQLFPEGDLGKGARGTNDIMKSSVLDLYHKHFVAKSDERLELFRLLARQFDVDKGIYPGSFVHVTPSFVIPEMVYGSTSWVRILRNVL